MSSMIWVPYLLAMASAVGLGPDPRVGRKQSVIFDRLAVDYLSAYWDFYPSWGSWAGRHEYDGVIPPRSGRKINEWVDFNRKTATALDTGRFSLLKPDEKIGLKLLRSTVAQQIIEFGDMKMHRRNPTVYGVSWGLLNLINRNYAPLDIRAKAAVRLLEKTPEILDHARQNLDAVIPRVYCEVAVDNYKGGAEFIRVDILEAFSAVKDEATSEKLAIAAAGAARAIEEFVQYLETEKLPKSDDSFAIGSAVVHKLLRQTEMISIPLKELQALGQADLERNLARAQAIAEKHYKGKSVREVMEMLTGSAYTAETLIPSIADELDTVRKFCVDKDLITIPSEVRPTVTETPKFSRWATAMMDTPGPFEKVATEAYYYVTPVDPNWSTDEQVQWLANFNKYVATNVSVHEAYPGHYVQFLHSNRAPTDLQKVLFSYAATEGWAHYTEQMMIEEGFHSDDPLYELAQIQDALLRNCRFVCSFRMHTEGMTVEQATRFFMDNAFVGELPARREARRGTFDPGYFNYTLGKLQILKLREDYKKKLGDRFTIKKFHDELLSHGMPPIAVTRERMLGPGSGPSL